MGETGNCKDDPKSLTQVRVQTARWLRQRSINAAVLLSANISEQRTSPSFMKTSTQTFQTKMVTPFDGHQNKVVPSSQKGHKEEQNNGKDKLNSNNNKEPVPTNLNDIPLSCTSLSNKLYDDKSRNLNHNHVSVSYDSRDARKKNKFSKSASLLVSPSLGMSKHQPFLSRSFDSNLALRVSPTNGSIRQRKKSIYDLATMSTSEDGILSVDLEQRAREEAERAMRSKKIFTIIGPYPSLRAALRRRGWVEKLPSMTPKSEGMESTSDHLSDEKNPELITTMSQVVRNSTPSFVFSVKAVDVFNQVTRGGQLVNHFARSSNFTTKAGLCHNMKNVPWFVHCDPNAFYPRCYNLANDEEKQAFRDDFQLMSCCCMLKHFLAKQSNLEVVMGGACSGNKRNARSSSAFSSSRGNHISECRKQSIELLVPMLRVVRSGHRSPLRTASADVVSKNRPIEGHGNDEKLGADDNGGDPVGQPNLRNEPTRSGSGRGRVVREDEDPSSAVRTPSPITIKAMKFALERCQEFIRFRENEDLDLPSNRSSAQKLGAVTCNGNADDDNISKISWNEFMEWSSAYVKGERDVESCASIGSECRKVLMMMRKFCPQYEMEGSRNVWIIKPGAKSRGRGIQCSDKLTEIMSTAASSDGQFVVQKYIERPLLVYRTKFDVRQWFLVTDWSPLTVWFYLDCYLRFCSREFTLDDFHASVHLSNNSVQKHFSPDPERSKNLPEDNMWTSDQFQEYLKRNGHGRVWTEYVVPEMKHAILCSLLCTQEHVECRKGAFELYGADFMITEDLKPWLLEINSSPSMAKNTYATSVLVDGVMEDMLKVVLDRRADRSCDTGRFELIYRQPPVPLLPNPNVSLTLHGRKIRKVALKK